MGTEASGTRLEIMSAVRRMPKGLSCAPACQIDTRPDFQVSAGPTEIAWEGKDESLLENHTAAVTRTWPGLYVKSRVRGVGDQVRLRITLWCEGEEAGAVEATLAGGEADLRARLGLSASSGR